LNKTHWVAHPQPGNLTKVEAGFKVGHGSYAANYSVTAKGAEYIFSTPPGTKGNLVLDTPSCVGQVSIVGTIVDAGGAHPRSDHGDGHGKAFHWKKQTKDHSSPPGPWKCGILGPTPPPKHPSAEGTITIDGLAGGNYTVEVTCL